SYTGTISGSYIAKKGGTTHTITWTIKGVRFELVHVRSAEGSWTGFYNVAAGKVSYVDKETGTCGYTLTEKFALAPAMPKHNPSTPFYMTRSMLSRENYGGNLEPKKRWTIFEACSYPDQDPEARQLTVTPRNMFDTGSKAGKVGRALSGKYVYKDDFVQSTTTYKWSLKPRG
ncbi:MAG: hypothetical protein QOJ29_4213, partial [Thermoleophilaceae bacterium]|nr:hypothetical protein [Thermoleophilaceae bacterium]